MAVSCKIKILQVKQLSCVMQENLISHDMFHITLKKILSNLIIIHSCNIMTAGNATANFSSLYAGTSKVPPRVLACFY